MFYKVTDWNRAYEIEPHIPQADAFYGLWPEEAAAFRAMLPAERRLCDLRYGPAPRNLMDLFLPEGTPRGLAVFIHGGYWCECDKDLWSHFARGPLDRGYAVCLPGYTLCPDIRISGIVREVAAAIELAAARIAGPIALSGHSAGGHLACRMVSGPAVLGDATLGRIAHVLSISGIHDLRPIRQTGMNATLQIDTAEAAAESPALLAPARPVRLTCWAGSAERAEFLRQNELLANIWAGLGCETRAVVEPDRHHFDVIDGLTSARSALTEAFLGPVDGQPPSAGQTRST